ncbi:MAG: GNAT family N-acetyltransferase [Acidimicrobiaceae bacterium]|nr:GNAT family N-acetyltransferase [Acidimicrobiaceae bacterium]
MLSIRRATPDDVDAVVALVTSAYRGQASREGWTTEADWIDGERTNPGEVAGIIAGPESLMLLVEDGDGPEAVLEACCQLARSGPGVAYFGMFAVRPESQGKGTGKLLLAEAESFAVRVWHAGVMRMTVINVRKELIDWYGRRGYFATGESQPFPYHDPAFGIPKVPDLEFTVLAKSLAAND